jgi:hypothetical protein
MFYSMSNVDVEDTESSFLDEICQFEEVLETLTEAVSDLQSMMIPPPRPPPPFPNMLHHLEMIKELKALFAQSQIQQNDKDTVEQLTVISSIIAGDTEAVSSSYLTTHQANQQSTNQSVVTITVQPTDVNTEIKADIPTVRSIKLSSIQSYFRDLPTLIFDPGGGHNQS